MTDSSQAPAQPGTSNNRRSYDWDNQLRAIGTGSVGGKAQGLDIIRDVILTELDPDEFPQVEVVFPSQTVICTDVFDNFMERNNLHEIANSDLPDDRIAQVFQRADLPFEVLGDLRALIERVHTPLAIRSSSLLEDSLIEPFAGVYATKMTPNNQFDSNTRFTKLVEAIKYVYSSTFFKAAKDYLKITKHVSEHEKMAVIVQQVMGKKHGQRFYPELSGVARSYNYYPMGREKPEDGVVNLALGLGKTIVEGEISWSYSPAYPKVDPPYRSVRELLKQTQTDFWAVNMGDPPEYNPIRETEYLLLENLATSEEDGTLRYLASTYNTHSDRLTIGTAFKGPRVITFAPLLVLEKLPLNRLIIKLLSICEKTFQAPVEIEFAMTFDPNRLGFLQVRPMVVSSEVVEVTDEDLEGDKVLLGSKKVLGNGIVDSIKDVVYVRPEKFVSKSTRSIAPELARINSKLINDSRPYILIAFGRLGTTDPWLGIPINWGEVRGAKVIVEATQENMNVVLSQGSHYFQNLIGLGISYFSVPHGDEYEIDWDWLNVQDIVEETQFVRHVKTSAPLRVKVDGRSGRGVIHKPEGVLS